MKIPLLLLIAIPSLVFAKISFRDSPTKPLETKFYELGPSEYLEDKTALVRLRCDFFPDYVIQTVIDPGSKGAAYKIVLKNKDATVQELCSKSTKLKSYDIHAGSLEGILNGVLVFTGEEPLGDVDHLLFYDLKTGKNIYTIKYDASSPVLIRSTGKSLGLDFYAHLGGPRENCNVVMDPKKHCLQKILTRNKIPAPHHLERPNCEEAVKFNPKDAQAGSVDLFLAASVKDIRRPRIIYTGKKLICSLAP